MDATLTKKAEALAIEVAADRDDVRTARRDPPRDVHDERDRIGQQCDPQVHA